MLDLQVGLSSAVCVVALQMRETLHQQARTRSEAATSAHLEALGEVLDDNACAAEAIERDACGATTWLRNATCSSSVGRGRGVDWSVRSVRWEQEGHARGLDLGGVVESGEEHLRYGPAELGSAKAQYRSNRIHADVSRSANLNPSHYEDHEAKQNQGQRSTRHTHCTFPSRCE